MNAALALRFLPFAFFFAISSSPLNVRTAIRIFSRAHGPQETRRCRIPQGVSMLFRGKTCLFPSASRIAGMKLADLRQEYMRAGLAEADADADPFRQSHGWSYAALPAKLRLPNAMTLATADADGRPSARIVLLKGVESGGFV